MIKVKVITKISTKRQADGTELRCFTDISDENEICPVTLGRYKGSITNVRVGNYRHTKHAMSLQWNALGCLQKNVSVPL